jgi:hypothetical protein
LTGRPGRERGRAYLLQIEVNTRGDDDDDVAWLLYYCPRARSIGRWSRCEITGASGPAAPALNEAVSSLPHAVTRVVVVV